MQSMLKSAFLVAVIGVGAVALFQIPTMAQRAFLKQVRTSFSMGPTTANGKCELCHAPAENEKANKENLNLFAKDLIKQDAMKPLLGKGDEHKFTEAELTGLMAAIEAIGGLDSDGDGVTNKEEILLGSFPGDKASLPDAAALKKHRESAKK